MFPKGLSKLQGMKLTALATMAMAVGFFAPTARTHAAGRSASEAVPRDAVASGFMFAQRSAANSKDFYVAPDGKDTNDGSRQHPWATISHAGKVVAPGSTVHVAAGTYDENVVTTAAGTASALIKYVSDQKWGAVIAPTSRAVFAWRDTGDYSNVVDFEIAGDNCGGIGLGGNHQAAVGNNVHNAADGCDDANGGSGINAFNYATEDDTVYRNYVHDVGISDSDCGETGHRVVHGVYIANRGSRVQSNIIANNCVFGIHLWHAATGAIITNNTVVSNRGGGILVGGGNAPCDKGGCPGGDDNTVVVNNISAFNGNPILHCWGIVEASRVTGPHNRYSHNLIYGTVGGPLSLANHLVCQDCLVGKDPEFVDPSSGDYHLRSDSPAIGKGIRLDVPAEDFDGRPFPGSGPITIGALLPGNQ